MFSKEFVAAAGHELKTPQHLKLDNKSFPDIYVNEEYLTQICNIFIPNSIAHTAKQTAIDICCSLLKNHMVEIRVRDYGPRINPHALPKIFEHFYRADKSRTIKGHYVL